MKAALALIMLSLVGACQRVDAQAPSQAYYDKIELISNIVDLMEWLKPLVTDQAAQASAGNKIEQHLRTAATELYWSGRKYAVIEVQRQRSGELIGSFRWGEPIYYGTGDTPAEAILLSLKTTPTILPALGPFLQLDEDASFYVIATIPSGLTAPPDIATPGMLRPLFAKALRDQAKQMYVDDALTTQLVAHIQFAAWSNVLQKATLHAPSQAGKAALLETRVRIESQRQKLREIEKDLRDAQKKADDAAAFQTLLTTLGAIGNLAELVDRVFTDFADGPPQDKHLIEPNRASLVLYMNRYVSHKSGQITEMQHKITLEEGTLKSEMTISRQRAIDSGVPAGTLDKLWPMN